MNESEDEVQNPLSEENWMKQNSCKFIKYVIHHRHPMTPDQLKQKPFEEIFKNQHEKVDTDEGESIEEEENSSTSSDKSEQNSDFYITTEDETNTTETHRVHNGSFPELCIYLASGRISFHLHYICISFAFRIAPRISIFALHFISI